MSAAVAPALMPVFPSIVDGMYLVINPSTNIAYDLSTIEAAKQAAMYWSQGYKTVNVYAFESQGNKSGWKRILTYYHRKQQGNRERK